MKRQTVAHELGAKQAKSLLKPSVSQQARNNGLKSTWSGNRWNGKRFGVRVDAVVRDSSVLVEVDALAYEREILDAIVNELERILRA